MALAPGMVASMVGKN